VQHRYPESVEDRWQPDGGERDDAERGGHRRDPVPGTAARRCSGARVQRKPGGDRPQHPTGRHGGDHGQRYRRGVPEHSQRRGDRQGERQHGGGGTDEPRRARQDRERGQDDEDHQPGQQRFADESRRAHPQRGEHTGDSGLHRPGAEDAQHEHAERPRQQQVRDEPGELGQVGARRDEQHPRDAGPEQPPAPRHQLQPAQRPDAEDDEDRRERGAHPDEQHGRQDEEPQRDDGRGTGYGQDNAEVDERGEPHRIPGTLLRRLPDRTAVREPRGESDGPPHGTRDQSALRTADRSCGHVEALRFGCAALQEST
jgi:hypothetical protein